ncbi:MAG: hypothetical protein MZV64_41375 [Ignavibacteriales bacterium]|nr:hypothetical protein [Ignavibacteriales bacterium]
METAMDVYKNCKLVWGDRRLDASGIYAQDINPSGQLGQPVIPVELTSFAGTVQGNAVLLNWSTSTETNNRGFEIERLQDNKIEILKDWDLIGFVHGIWNCSRATLLILLPMKMFYQAFINIRLKTN